MRLIFFRQNHNVTLYQGLYYESIYFQLQIWTQFDWHITDKLPSIWTLEPPRTNLSWRLVSKPCGKQFFCTFASKKCILYTAYQVNPECLARYLGQIWMDCRC